MVTYQLTLRQVLLKSINFLSSLGLCQIQFEKCSNHADIDVRFLWFEVRAK